MTTTTTVLTPQVERSMREQGLQEFYRRLERSTELTLDPDSSRKERARARLELLDQSEVLADIQALGR